MVMAKTTTDTVQEYKALREEILGGDIKPFYLLFGKEHYYIDELCKLLMDKVVPPEERDFGQIVYFGADVTANQVVSTARQFPMMVARQLVVVKEAQMMKKVEDIGVYFEGIMPTTVLVVCYKTNNDPTKSGKSIDKRSTFYKQAKKFGVAFESNPIPDYRIARWIDSYVGEQGMKIAPDAAALLAESAGTDLQKLALTIDKLRKLLPEERAHITITDIEENVGMSRDYSAFELTKALSMKDTLKAFRIVQFFADSPPTLPHPDDDGRPFQPLHPPASLPRPAAGENPPQRDPRPAGHQPLFRKRIRHGRAQLSRQEDHAHHLPAQGVRPTLQVEHARRGHRRRPAQRIDS